MRTGRDSRLKMLLEDVVTPKLDLGAVKQEIATLESQLSTFRGKMAGHLNGLGL